MSFAPVPWMSLRWTRASVRAALICVLTCGMTPLVVASNAAATTDEVPVAASTATEFIDETGTPLAILENGVTATVFIAGDSAPRLKMQWIDAQGQPLFTAGGLDVAGDAGAVAAASIVRRPAGGAYVVYGQETPSGGQHFYAQAFNRSGVAQWPGDGVRVSNLPDTQLDVSLTPDFAGGLYACFSRPAASKIQCQHLDRDGDRLWSEAGLDAGGEPGLKVRPQTVYDGAEGVLVFWRNQGSLDDKKPDFMTLEGQHFNSPGYPLWANGIEIRNTFLPESTDVGPSILVALNDGFGGAYLIFEALLTVNAQNLDVVMQRVSGSGNILWEDQRPVIADPAATELETAVPAPDGGFAVITREPAGDSGSRLRLFRLDDQGFQKWDADGIELTAPGSDVARAFPHASFESGVLWVAWSEQLSPGSTEMDIQLARFGLNGRRLNRHNIPVTTAPNSQFCQGLAFDPATQRTAVLWDDLRKGSPDDMDVYLRFF
ncbi:MAG: hypothetical protein AAGM22_33495 [Acidobacteriota bacterium]